MGGRGGSSHRQTAGGTASIQTFLQNAYGANHANAVLAILQNAPAHIRALWEQYAAQFRATNMRRDEGAFYSPRDDSVHLHIPSVARGDAISTPYSVLFHEYGHMADYLIARGEGYSHISYSDLFQGVGAGGKPILRHGSAGGLLGRIAKDELEGHLSRMRRQNPNMTRDQAARALVSEARGKYSIPFLFRLTHFTPQAQSASAWSRSNSCRSLPRSTPLPACFRNNPPGRPPLRRRRSARRPVSKRGREYWFQP